MHIFIQTKALGPEPCTGPLYSLGGSPPPGVGRYCSAGAKSTVQGFHVTVPVTGDLITSSRNSISR